MYTVDFSVNIFLSNLNYFYSRTRIIKKRILTLLSCHKIMIDTIYVTMNKKFVHVYSNNRETWLESQL